jgi:hypothetical protein
MAEVAHLHRVVTLLPQLEDQLERTIVPDAAASRDRVLAAGRQPQPHHPRAHS